MRGKTNALIGGGGGGSTPTEEKTVQAVEFPTIVEPRSGYALSKATVTAPDNLLPENIKEGITIAGVIGTVSGEAFPDDWKGAQVSSNYYTKNSHTIEFQSYSGTENIYYKTLETASAVYSPSTGMCIIGNNPNAQTTYSNNRVIATAPEMDITIPNEYIGPNGIAVGAPDIFSVGDIFKCRMIVYREIGPSIYNSNNGQPQAGEEYTCEVKVSSLYKSTYSIRANFIVVSTSTNDFHFDEHEFIAGSYSAWSDVYACYRTAVLSLEKIS